MAPVGRVVPVRVAVVEGVYFFPEVDFLGQNNRISVLDPSQREGFFPRNLTRDGYFPPSL